MNAVVEPVIGASTEAIYSGIAAVPEPAPPDMAIVETPLDTPYEP